MRTSLSVCVCVCVCVRASASRAKVFADMPLSVLEPIFFVTIVYFMAGFQRIFWNFFMFLLTVGTWPPPPPCKQT
jgi:hypothetical protein